MTKTEQKQSAKLIAAMVSARISREQRSDAQEIRRGLLGSRPQDAESNEGTLCRKRVRVLLHQFNERVWHLRRVRVCAT